MRNIKLVLAYDGTHLHGWQRQKEGRTVQGEVEKAIRVMTGEPVPLIGAGRTDAGVHARAMTANFKTSSAIPMEGFIKGLNSLLPDDIRITEAAPASLSFHARADAAAKVYDYQFSLETILSPLERYFWAHFIEKKAFEQDAVEKSLSSIVGEHDFTSFEASGSRLDKTRGRGGVRRIFSARLFQLEHSSKKYYFRIIGDGFLRHMVRNIVGTIMEIGMGRRHADSMPEILAARDRQAAGPTAPACGLILREVLYSRPPPESAPAKG